MLRLFKIRGGLIQEIQCPAEQLEQALPQADWIDAHEPDEGERALLQRLLHTDLPELDDVEEIEASARFSSIRPGSTSTRCSWPRPRAGTVPRPSPASSRRNA